MWQGKKLTPSGESNWTRYTQSDRALAIAPMCCDPNLVQA
jgi:hypothetical protein